VISTDANAGADSHSTPFTLAPSSSVMVPMLSGIGIAATSPPS
jgi:hypothetical protein